MTIEECIPGIRVGWMRDTLYGVVADPPTDGPHVRVKWDHHERVLTNTMAFVTSLEDEFDLWARQVRANQGVK